MSASQPAILVTAADLAPQAIALLGDYEVVFAGKTPSDDDMVATTMRLVNAIPYVRDAPAGLTTSLDLPLTTPRYAFP